MINFVFIPIGSYEQHGPHLPPETDYLIAKRIAEKVAPAFKGKIIEGIKIGISSEHEEFINTKSISKVEFENQVNKLLKNFYEETKFFLINAHGGNNDALCSIKRQYQDKLLVLNTFSIIKKDLMKIRTSNIGGICHAGEFETSIMMYLFPNSVNMIDLKKSDIKYVPYLDPNYEFEKLKRWKTKDLSISGILGDPFHASREKGEIWFKLLIEKIISLIEVFINQYKL
ncbi:MAG: creatininase family protein [Promethearchaeota archaeon]